MPDETTKGPKRNTLTIILKTPDQVALKNRLEMELAKGKLEGRYPQDLTLSELAARLLQAQMTAPVAVQKKTAKKPVK